MKTFLNYSERERQCELSFERNGPFWHITTPGKYTEDIFLTDEEFKAAVSFIGVCAAAIPRVRIIAFSVMRNHVHFILAGDKDYCIAFFDLFRRKLSRYLHGRGRTVDLSGFHIGNPIPITDLRMLRTEIAYVHRNGYVANKNHTPFSYPWSDGFLYFNPFSQSLSTTPFNELKRDVKRSVTSSRNPELPNHYTAREGMIWPLSFCSTKEGESYFHDAHQYFNMLSKALEAYSETSKRLDDKIELTADELYAACCEVARKDYNVSGPLLVPIHCRREYSLKLKRDYGATRSDIRRIVKLGDDLLNEIFPESSSKQ